MRIKFGRLPFQAVFWAAVTFAVIGAQYALAQTGPQCGPWPDVAAGLQKRYGESVLFEGTPNPGQGGVVITAKPDGTTWTALSLSPDGRIACLRAGGGGVADGVRAACGRGGLT